MGEKQGGGEFGYVVGGLWSPGREIPMKLTFATMAVVLAFAAPAMAQMGAAQQGSAQDQAHIAAIEGKLRLPNAPADAPTKTLAQRMVDAKVPAVSIAFIEDGKIEWTRAYGLADVASGRAATPDTLFQAASTSKALAAVASLRLVEQGKLDLDQDVNARLKGWKVPPSPFTAVDKVTLRRLLSHTAGLNVHGFPGYEAGKPVPTTVQVLEGAPPANTPAVVSDARPGEKWDYSGGGYTVAQLMLEEASGEAYPTLVTRLVLKPAGMTRSTLIQPLPAAMRARAATAYHRDGAPVPGLYHTYPEYAAAGLWTTPSDYGRFIIALQDAYAGRSTKMLKAGSVKLMATPILNDYGLGVEAHDRDGHRTIEHSGGKEGFQCYFLGFLDGSRQGVVIMTNSDNAFLVIQELLQAVGETYGWGERGPAKP
jgi:CubicO group peptidase (beta-lactamase class C family)